MILKQRPSRRTPTKLLTTLLAALWLVGIHVREAHAYLDPGTGSILLQSTLALIAGTAVTLKLYWSKLKELIRRRRPEQSRRPLGDE